MTLNLLIRKAIPVEIETLADIAFVAWERRSAAQMLPLT